MEKGRGGVSKPAVTHKIISFESGFKIIAMDAQSASHEHVLWPLSDFAIYFLKVATFQSLEAKEIISEIS